jgi:hypothetical protein
MRECVHYSPVRYDKNATGLVLCSEVVSLQHLRTYILLAISPVFQSANLFNMAGPWPLSLN